MGLIRAAIGSTGGVLADQWKEFFYCDAISSDVLAVQGKKRVSRRSSNTKGTDNVISSGSVIAVADGQCMLIVEQGKVVEVCAEPGEFIFDSSTEPTIFQGDLGTSVAKSLENIGKRFAFGGVAPTDQRVYYFNTKEILGNKYGTASPVPFRVVDANIGLDMDISVRCFGEYSYHIFDPVLLYTNVTGNFEGEYSRTNLESQLRTELLTALQPAFAQISAAGVRYSAVPAHTVELADSLNQQLTAKWRQLRGIEIVSFGVSSIKANEEDEQTIKDLQKAATMRDPNMRAAVSTAASADAMRTAAGNEAGAMTGFMGMGMANMFGASAMNGAVQVPQGQAPQYPNQYGTAANGGFVSAQPAAPASAAAAGAWTCSCGAKNTGKFCIECGSPKPAPVAAGSWTCSCGAVNTGKFCPECGAKKPAGVPQYKCDKCGWVPADPAKPPKFCPECGDPFGDEDLV